MHRLCITATSQYVCCVRRWATNGTKEWLLQNQTGEHCLFKEEIPYENVIENVKNIEENGSQQLSAFPKYITDEGIMKKPEL